MTFKLRTYQQDSIDALFKYFKEKDGNPILALPTGTGKSHCIAGFIKKVFALYNDQRIMIVSHVKEILSQNKKALLTQWPTAPAGIYSAGLKKRETFYPIIFAGIASVVKKAELFGKVSLLCVDECHLVSDKKSSMYQKFIHSLKKVNPYLKVIGYSATPFRLSSGFLTDGKLFTDTCFDITTRDGFRMLLNNGYMAPLIAKKPNAEIDTSAISVRGGEFVLKDIQATMKDKVTLAALKETLRLASNRKSWLVFCSGIDHAEKTASMLNSMGVKTGVIHSKLSNKERDRTVEAFKRGELTAITNQDVMTTGVDIPKIDLIVLLRPTMSTALHVQILGRGTRPFEGKENCVVLDFVGNTMRLGPIDDPVIPRKRGKKGSGSAPIKTCEKCMTMNHATVRFCANCGQEFHQQVKIKTTASTATVMRAVESKKIEPPQIELFKVNRVLYNKHNKKGSPSSLKVTYYCGLRNFNEWICLEHGGYAGRKAKEWWYRALKRTVPKTIDEALEQVNELPIPSTIKVIVNKKYPEIISREYAKHKANT
jgi:DNA repair protein RadD